MYEKRRSTHSFILFLNGLAEHFLALGIAHGDADGAIAKVEARGVFVALFQHGEEYIISTYPVAVQWWDIILVIAMVFALSVLSAWIPARKIKN